MDVISKLPELPFASVVIVKVSACRDAADDTAESIGEEAESDPSSSLVPRDPNRQYYVRRNSLDRVELVDIFQQICRRGDHHAPCCVHTPTEQECT